MKIIKRLKEYLNNSEIDIRERSFMLLALTALTGILVANISGILIGESMESILTSMGSFVIFTSLVWIGFRFDKVIAVSYIVAFILIAVVMPINFFTGGAIHGGAIAWIVFDTIYVVMVTIGRIRVAFLSFEAIAVAFTYYLYLAYPGLTIRHTEETALADSISSVALVSILTTIMLSFQISLYRRENERMLQQSDEINDLNRAQNRFFSSMSHEIRTPINTIIGLNEMILRENASPEINEDAEHIESASKMLLHLINDILDMSKFNSGQMTLTPTAFYVSDMISDVVDMIWVRAKEKGLQFEVDVSPMLPEEIMGDEMRLKQILINILNNAVKYTREGSVTLTISSSDVDDHQVRLVFSVSDTGMGIRKESIPFLFDAFRRVDEERTAMIEGTGLGLSIVKQFVDLMGGQITVNSVYTKGSTFTVEIPVRRIGSRYIGEMNEDRGQFGSRSAYRVSFSAPGAHVLVVDDTQANRLVVEKLLRDTKIHVTCVGNGRECLEKTSENKYDVIFMDHLMPEMSGIECLHRIRSQTGGQSRNARVVALTANAGSENSLLYAREGFDGYLVKPISGRMLENELMRLLPQDLVTITDKDKDLEEKSSLWRDTHEMKAMVAISTDSLVALPRELMEMHDIAVIPARIETEDGVFRDGIDITTEGLLRYIEDEEELPRVLGVQTEEFVNFFANRLREARTLIHISTSGIVSARTLQAAREAARSFDDVMVIDSGYTSGAMGLMVIRAVLMAENGSSPGQIRDALEEISKKIISGFVTGNLDYMTRSGRFSRTVNNVARAFMMRPVIEARKGKLRIVRFYFGSPRRVWRRYIRRCLKHSESLDKSLLLVIYVGLDASDREWVREQIDSLVKFESIRFLQQPPSVTVSCGPGALSLVLMKK